MRDLWLSTTDFGHFGWRAADEFTEAMAGSVFVSDERALDVSVGVAQVRLTNLVQDGWLSKASQQAYQSSVDQLVRIGPFGAVPGASRLVRVRFVDPVYRDGAMTLGIRWEAIGVTGGLFPVLDGDIRLSGKGSRGSLVVLTASYRPPLRATGAGLDRLLLHKVASATIRAFLASVAGVLEGGIADLAGEVAPASWGEFGPEPATE